MRMTDDERRVRDRERQRKYREQKRTGQAASVSRIHAAPDSDAPQPAEPGPSVLDVLPGPGEYEREVRAQLDGYGDLTASEQRGMAVLCVAMARILDNPALSPQWPSAGGQLRAALQLLHEASKAQRLKSSKVRMLRSKHAG